MSELGRAIVWEALYALSGVPDDRREFVHHGRYVINEHGRDTWNCEVDMGPVPRIWRALKYDVTDLTETVKHQLAIMRLGEKR